LSVDSFLKNRGWDRGPVLDAGVYHEHTKYFPGAGVTAVVGYDPGLSASGMQFEESQELTECAFIRAGVDLGWRQPRPQVCVPLGEIDPVVISEVLADLIELASRGK